MENDIRETVKCVLSNGVGSIWVGVDVEVANAVMVPNRQRIVSRLQNEEGEAVSIRREEQLA